MAYVQPEPREDSSSPQHDLDRKRPKALGHDHDKRASPRAGTPQKRERVGESRNFDRGVKQTFAPMTAKGAGSINRLNNTIGASLNMQAAREAQIHPQIEQSEKPGLDAGREPTRETLQRKGPGIPDVEEVFGIQSQSEPRKTIQVQHTPSIDLERSPMERDQGYLSSAPSSLGKGKEKDEQSVQDDDEKEIPLLEDDQKAQPTEWRQESRFLHDKIFSSLDYVVQRALFAIPLGIHMIRYFRPKLPAKCKRIEWQCSCGVLLYADYRITSPASALALESLERRLRTATLSSGNDTSYTSPSTSGQSDKARGSPSSQTTMSSVDLTDLPPSATHSPDGSSSMRQKHGSGRTNAQTLLELCVNTAPLRTVLEEILITTRGGTDHIDNDFSLFRKSSLWDTLCPFD